MSFIEAMCLATSSSTLALTGGTHNLCRSSFKDFAISVGCLCRLLPPNRNAIVGIVARNAGDVVSSRLNSGTNGPQVNSKTESKDALEPRAGQATLLTGLLQVWLSF